ncbi:unnamed protein product [Urochloa humidicola]
MATVVSRLLRAACKAHLASRAAAAASRAAAVASRSARAAAAAAAASRAARFGSGVAPLESGPTRGSASTKPRYDAPRRPFEYFSSSDFESPPDDAKTPTDKDVESDEADKTVIDDAKSPTDKDVESDEAVWALYERWCKAFNKKRDHAEMVRRFKIFRYFAKDVHHWNTYLPPDPEEAAIYVQKRREAQLLLSKGESVSNFDECHLPMELGPCADGGDPFINEHCKRLLKSIEEMDSSSAVEDVTAE